MAGPRSGLVAAVVWTWLATSACTQPYGEEKPPTLEKSGAKQTPGATTGADAGADAGASALKTSTKVIPVRVPAASWKGECVDAPAYPGSAQAGLVKGCVTTFLDQPKWDAISIETNAPFDFGATIPKSGELAIDLSSMAFLVFQVAARNENPTGWQGNFPVVVIGSGSQIARYEPTRNLLPTSFDEDWVTVRMALAGDRDFQRKSGEPPKRADWIEIHSDTWETKAVQIWISGIQFEAKP